MHYRKSENAWRIDKKYNIIKGNTAKILFVQRGRATRYWVGAIVFVYSLAFLRRLVAVTFVK